MTDTTPRDFAAELLAAIGDRARIDALLESVPPGQFPSVSRELDSIAQNAAWLAGLCDYLGINRPRPGWQDRAQPHGTRRVNKVRKALGYNVTK